jgi:hypothetical protein
MTETASGKVPVGAVVAASWRFLAQNWRQLFPAALVVAAVTTLGPLLVLMATGPTAGGVYLGALVTVIAGVPFTAAVLRKAVRNEFLGPLGLSFGRDEGNLIGALLCMALLLLPAVFIFGIVLSVVMAGRLVAAGVDPATTEIPPELLERALNETLLSPAGSLSALALCAILIVVSARLSMVNAATMGERKIVFLQTWSWTKGNVVRVIAALLLTALPVVALELLFLMSGFEAGNLGVAIAVSYVGSLLGLIAGIPVIALGANLYKGLRPPDFVAK